MRQGRYVHSPPAVRRRRIVTVSAAATPGSRLAVDARRRGGGARHLHAIGPPDRVTIGPEAMLLERALELEVLHTAVTRLAGGAGGVVVLAAPAGLGKTALLEHAVLEAAEAGCRVRRAASGPARAPLRVRRGARAAGGAAARRVGRASARGCSKGRRRRPAPCSSTAPCPVRMPPWRSPTACCGCAPPWPSDAPLVLVVDDAHWADRASLEVLAYLARRIGELPLLIAVGARADDPDAAADLLSLIGGAPAATVLHPLPLSRAARRGSSAARRRPRRSTSAATAIARRPATRGCWASSAARSPTTARAQSTPPKASPRP